MIAANQRGNLRKGLVCFTLLYGVLVALICAICAHYGKCIVWYLDGIMQHYTSFIYARQTAQSILNGTFSVYSFAIGEGVDILTTLNSYGLTDPFTYICLLFGENQQVLAYTVMTFAKIYAAGVFSLFYIGHVRKKYTIEVVLSALLYITTGYCLIIVFKHPNFYCGVLYLPLILLCVDYVFERKREVLLTVAVALLALSDYYSFYMDTVMAGVYILVRLFLQRKEGYKKGISVLLRLAFFYILGIGCAAVSLVPTVFAYLNNCRVGMRTGYTDSLLVYPLQFYGTLYFGLLSFFSVPFTTIIGLSAAEAMILLCFVFTKKKEWRKYKAGLIGLFVCLCLPVVGLIENGFGYVTNRWSYAFTLMCSICCSMGMEEVLAYKKGNKSLLTACLIALFYAVSTSSVAIFRIVKINKRGYVVRTAIVLMLVVGMFVLISRMSNKTVKKRLLQTCVYITILANIFFYATPYGMGTIYSLMRTEEEANAGVTGGILKSAEEYMGDGFYRIESTNLRNEGLGQQKNITSSWWSLMDKQRMEYYQTMELPTMDQNCRLEGLGANPALTTLASVRYYLPKRKESPVPYGYTPVHETEEYALYENQYALPLGYCYSAYLTEDEFAKLPTVQKYQALTQAVVLSEKDAQGSVVPHADYQPQIQSVDYTLQTNPSVKVADGKIQAVEKKGSFALEFEAPEGYEVYIRFGGLKLYKKEKIEICLTCEGVEKRFFVSSPLRPWYAPMSGYTCKIADGKAGKQTCTVSFMNTSEYTYDTIELWALPVQTYVDAVEKLGETVMNVEEMRGAYIRGSINATEPSLLNLSIPYVRGWTAYVDGEEAHLVRTNTYYMGLMLENGEHTIELKYETPYLKIGMAVSVLSILGVVLVLVYSKRKGRKE